MPRNIKDIHRQSQQFLPLPLRENDIWPHRLYAQRKTVTLEKILLRHHRNRIRMACDLASMPPFDRRRIGHVIPVTMGQNQQADFFTGKIVIGPLRRVEKNRPFRSLDQEAVRFVGPARKSFELKHWKEVEPMLLIFLAQPDSQGDQLLLHA